MRAHRRQSSGSPGPPAGLAVLAVLDRDRLGQRRPPRGSLEGVAEVLALVADPVPGEIHDAHRERRDAVVRDDALADPQSPASADPADREMPIGRMPAALLLDGRAT